MSKMADFYAKVVADADLRAKLTEILGETEISQATDEQLVKIGEIAKEAGFEVTLEEAKAYLASEAKDLSDDALDAVAGGTVKGAVTCSGEGAGVKDKTDVKIK